MDIVIFPSLYGGSMAIAVMLRQDGFLTVFFLGVVVGFLLHMAFSAYARGKAAKNRVMENGVVPAATVPAAQAGPVLSVQAGASVINTKTVAAITAAVFEYRKNNA